MEETINNIIERKLSVARYGDGEFSLLLRKGGISFQELNNEISDALNASFKINDPGLLVCIVDYTENTHFNTKYSFFIKDFVLKNYRFLRKIYNYNYCYGNANVTRFYHPSLFKHTDYNYIENKFIPLLKRIWNGRHLLMVEGEETKLGCGTDLFANSSSIERIICPATNAYRRYYEIRKAIIKHYKKQLLLVALGPTATLLASDLSINNGYQIIDIGHIDVVYLWFKNKAKDKNPIKGKQVVEQSGFQDINISFDDDVYKNQIVEIIE